MPSWVAEDTFHIKKKQIWNSKAKLKHVKNKLHTDWLSLQEVNVMKHLPLLGSQVVQPVLDDALTLLNN